jgi:WD40 repeat protein
MSPLCANCSLFFFACPLFIFFSQITCGDDCTGRLWDTYDRYLKNTVDLKKKARSVTISCQPLWAGGEEEEKEEEEKKNESNNDNNDNKNNKNNNDNKNNKKEKIRHAAFGLFNGEVVVHRVDLTTDGLGKKGCLARFHCCKEWIQDMKYSPDNRKLAVSSHDNRIYVIDVGGAFGADQYHAGNKMAVCHGHSSYISHIDFSQDSRFLQSTSGDYELLFWDTNSIETVKGGKGAGKKGSQTHRKVKQATHVSQFTGKSWSTFTCPLGWDVQGIWPPNVDGTDINAVERSHGKYCTCRTCRTCRTCWLYSLCNFQYRHFDC